MNFEDYANEGGKSDILKKISDLVKTNNDLDVEISRLTQKLKEAKEAKEGILREDIPELMQEANTKSVQLISGEKIDITDKVFASIRKGDEARAFKYMVQVEIGQEPLYSDEKLATEMIKALWKTNYSAEGITEEQESKLLGLKLPFDCKKSIHAMTLKKWAKEKLEAGINIDKEVINTFTYQEAVIKK